MDIIKTARRAIEKSYDKICEIREIREFKDEEGISREREVIVRESFPCRISFINSPPASQSDITAAASQRVKLFISPEIKVRNGAIIRVRGAGEFGFVGESRVYETHREVECEKRGEYE